MDSIIPLEVIARETGVSLRTLGDSAWRARVGLPVVKLGGKILGVRAADLATVLRREFEPKKGAACPLPSRRKVRP